MEYRGIYVCDCYETFVSKQTNQLYPYTHLNIPLGGYCLTSLTCPYGSNSDIVRTLYQTKLSKQAMVYTPCGNYHEAFYAKMPILFNLYKPLISTVASQLIETGGADLMVGIICAENQEDSMDSRERLSQSMKLSCILTNPISVELESGQSLGTPDPATVQNLKCRSYSHLIKGIPKPGTIIKKDMAILGIIRTDPTNKQMYDESLIHKKDNPVIVDHVSEESNSKAIMVIKIRTYTPRHIKPGDKVAAVSGNKGIISIMRRDEKFYILEDGTSIDLLMSPFAIPTRLTVNQLFAGRNADLASMLGVFVNGNMFNDPENPELIRMAKEKNLNYMGIKYVYNGVTGQRVKSAVFCVPQRYQRLTKMVADQSNVVDNPSIDIKTGQSNKGVGTGGGIRFGEMEKDNIISNGTTNFLQYKMIDKCDAKDICVCNTCKKIAIFNIDANIYVCKTCRYSTFTTVRTTTATLTYLNYLEALGVSVKLGIEAPKFVAE
jgi:DNA-directed RNA polymerase II subunit RPB2